jgi:hypothetical protein
MAKRRWIKDYCPFAKDQGFMGVVGDVAPGETVFGFTVTLGASPTAMVFSTQTGGKIKMMKDTYYRVQITKVTAGSIAGANPYIAAKTKSQFSLYGEAGAIYDIIVIGHVNY